MQITKSGLVVVFLSPTTQPPNKFRKCQVHISDHIIGRTMRFGTEFHQIIAEDYHKNLRIHVNIRYFTNSLVVLNTTYTVNCEPKK